MQVSASPESNSKVGKPSVKDGVRVGTKVGTAVLVGITNSVGADAGLAGGVAPQAVRSSPRIIMISDDIFSINEPFLCVSRSV